MKTVCKLELFLRVAAKLQGEAGHRDRVAPLPRDLHELLIRFWEQFKVLVLVFKAL